MKKGAPDLNIPRLELDLGQVSYIDIDTYVEGFMRNLKDSKLIANLSSTQLRKIHEYVSRIKRLFLESKLGDKDRKLESCEKELVKFRVFLAYQRARLSDRERPVYERLSEWFRNTTEAVVKSLQNLEEAEKLIEKMYAVSEALIAYHKYYGGV